MSTFLCNDERETVLRERDYFERETGLREGLVCR
jgi:hypothetical protein